MFENFFKKCLTENFFIHKQKQNKIFHMSPEKNDSSAPTSPEPSTNQFQDLLKNEESYHEEDSLEMGGGTDWFLIFFFLGFRMGLRFLFFIKTCFLVGFGFAAVFLWM